MNFGMCFTILFSLIFVNNFVLSRFLGLCPYIGVSKSMEPAIGMGAAVTFVTTLASTVTWIIYRYALIPLKLEYMSTITFILVIATLVQIVEMVIRKTSEPLYKALGIYLPLITTNCIVLGVTILNIDMFFKNGAPISGSFLMTALQGFGSGAGFSLAMILMAGIRGHLETMDLPEAFKGVPITFIVAGLMAIAFLGFSGLSF